MLNLAYYWNSTGWRIFRARDFACTIGIVENSILKQPSRKITLISILSRVIECLRCIPICPNVLYHTRKEKDHCRPRSEQGFLAINNQYYWVGRIRRHPEPREQASATTTKTIDACAGRYEFGPTSKKQKQKPKKSIRGVVSKQQQRRRQEVRKRGKQKQHLDNFGRTETSEKS